MRTWLLLLLTLAFTTAAFWSSVVSILHTWSSNPFGHGYFVVPAVAYLVWKRGDRLHALPPEASLAGLALTAAGAFAWLVGTLTATEIFQGVAWFVVAVGLVWGLTGGRAISILLFPLGLLPLALPLFDRIVPFLQSLTAWNAVALLKLLGVPVLLQGHLMVLPASSWEVAEACSGINYLLTTLVMGYVYAGVRYRTTRNRVVFLLACIVVPLLGNSLRVFTTILIASFGATGIASGLSHNFYGLVVFAVITYVVLAICGDLKEPGADADRPIPPPGQDAPQASARRQWRSSLAGMAAVSIVSLAYIAAVFLPVRRVDDIASVEIQAPPRWAPAVRAPFNWRPSFFRPAREDSWTFVSAADAVKVAVATYDPTQTHVKVATAGHELYALPWTLLGDARRQVTIGGQSVTVRELTIQSGATTLVVWRWYRVAGTLTGSDYVAKVLLAGARLTRSRDASEVFVVAAEDRRGRAAAAVLDDFVKATRFDRSPHAQTAGPTAGGGPIADCLKTGPGRRNHGGGPEGTWRSGRSLPALSAPSVTDKVCSVSALS